MTRQVLILNITRMGDLAQTVPLLARLEQEWSGVAIDLVVDTRLASMAALLPGPRQVLTYDFHDLLAKSRLDPQGTDMRISGADNDRLNGGLGDDGWKGARAPTSIPISQAKDTTPSMIRTSLEILYSIAKW